MLMIHTLSVQNPALLNVGQVKELELEAQFQLCQGSLHSVSSVNQILVPGPPQQIDLVLLSCFTLN